MLVAYFILYSSTDWSLGVLIMYLLVCMYLYINPLSTCPFVPFSHIWLIAFNLRLSFKNFSPIISSIVFKFRKPSLSQRFTEYLCYFRSFLGSEFQRRFYVSFLIPLKLCCMHGIRICIIFFPLHMAI